MADRSHSTRTPEPGNKGNSLYFSSNYSSGPQYSSGAEGAQADFSSSHGTPYASPAPSWNTEHESRSNHDWCGPATQHLSPGFSPNNIGKETSAPSTRNRGTPKRKASPASQRSRKTKNTKSAKSGSVTLDAPLSRTTQNSNVPLKDMGKFVHRSVEERVREKEKKNGHIVRPMNAFMLYRSAYAERAKSLFAQNNHQIVSKATGQSWRLETSEVQDYYKNLAEIERENHAKAWPNYKFTPSKTGPGNRKAKESELESGDEGTEADVSDEEWTPSGLRKVRPNHTSSRRRVRGKELGSPYPQQRRPIYPATQMPLNASHFGITSPSRPIPLAMQEMSSFHPGPHYYQPTGRYALTYPGTEDSQFEQLGYGHGGMVSHLPDYHRSAMDAHHENPFGPYLPHHGGSYYGHIDPKLEDFGLSPQPGMFTEDGFDAYHGDLLAQQGHQAPSEDHGSPHQRSFAEMLANEDGFAAWIESENRQ